MSTEIASLVTTWLAQDKNEATRAEITQLWEAGNVEELEKRLRKRIEFGTAGLRGRMEAGFSRMNDLTVLQASQGLCAYILENVPDCKTKGFVVGHDHRHHSAHWANLVARVFLHHGFNVYLHRKLVHTPMVPFTVSKKGAAGGVMITASHNPKDDNGYKVYWENAVQIIAPHDVGIAAKIQENLVPVFDDWAETTSIVDGSDRCLDVTEEMHEEYFAMIANSTDKSLNATTELLFVTTPMHGVGHAPVSRAIVASGFQPEAFVVVEEQRDPDPDFPTVSFPNPEEKGALELAIQTANKAGAHYILAQDPDADRFAAAQKKEDGTWHAFTGDQLGNIFAASIVDKYKQSGQPMDKLAIVASTVSSKLIESMAIREKFKFVESLTGFKYIGNVAQSLHKEGFTVPFGYEEAIGYMIGETIRDKDGVTATIAFAELVTRLHKRGSSALAYLDEIYSRYGYFTTKNSYFICTEAATIDAIFARLRHYPEGEAAAIGTAAYPRTIAGLGMTGIRDLTTGYGYDTSQRPTYTPALPISGGHMITFKAGHVIKNGAAINLTIRTSGTEPKIKYYLEGKGRDRNVVNEILTKVVEDLRTTWVQATDNGLAEP